MVRGNVYAKGGRLCLTNSGSGGSKNKTVGPVLAGSLTLEDGTGLDVYRKWVSNNVMPDAMVQGNVELINCRINRETENSFQITRRYGEGPAVDGNITLWNSQLYIDATYARASGNETPSVQNCVLSLQNSHFTVRGSGSWKDVWLDEDYRWYAGDDAPNVPFYKDGREEPLRAEALTKAAYVDIYTGDKVGAATVHDASFTESKTIDGFASWPMSFDVTVQMTGDTLDLHCGGQDLIFPHHENEIAQSEAATGKAFSHYWMHNGYINIDNKKMSKSLGNFFTVREVAEQYGYEVIRYMMIQAHYRSPINYCKELLDACKASLERLYTCRNTLDRAIAAAPAGDCSEAAKELFAQWEQQFITAMDDDLNTADGITALFELARELNRMSADATTSKGQLEAGAKLFDSLTDVLGILYQRKQEDAIPAEVQTLIEERAAARKAKNFAEADRLRDAIAALGYRVKETRQGTQIEKL